MLWVHPVCWRKMSCVIMRVLQNYYVWVQRPFNSGILYTIPGEYSHFYVLKRFCLCLISHQFSFSLRQHCFPMQARFHSTQINIVSFSKGNQLPDNSENSYFKCVNILFQNYLTSHFSASQTNWDKLHNFVYSTKRATTNNSANALQNN